MANKIDEAYTTEFVMGLPKKSLSELFDCFRTVLNDADITKQEYQCFSAVVAEIRNRVENVELDTAVVRESMETYILFAEKRSVIGNARADFYVGAAAALNDLMCRIGHGDIVDDLATRIPKGE